MRAQAYEIEVQTALCAHCGETCTSTGVELDGISFCCSGCRSVYEILQSANLCNYYDISQDAGSSQKNNSGYNSRYEGLELDSIVSSFIDYRDANTTRINFFLPGMHCASCVWLLEQLSKFNPGILSSRVDLLRKTIHIVYHHQSTNPKSIASLLHSVGYPPLLTAEDVSEGTAQARKYASRQLYMRIGVAGFATGNIMMISIAGYLADGKLDSTLALVLAVLSISISIPVYFYSAWPWLSSAFQTLRRKALNLDVPVALGISTLFIRSIFEIVSGIGEGFLDSFAGLVFFLLIGKLFQQRAFDAVSFDRTVRSFFPLSARRLRGESEEIVPIGSIQPGDRLLVRNGEIVPADSIVTGMVAYVDYSFVTGESTPIECTSGSLLYAGGKVIGQATQVTTVKHTSTSYLASLWERSASEKKRQSYVRLSDRFGLWFTVGVVFIAVVGFLFWMPDLAMSSNVFTAVLIIACPCALTLATPITLGTAMGVLGRFGIYVKSTGVLLDLVGINHVVFDKTGTITESDSSIQYQGRPLSTTEEIAVASVTAQSTHPISVAVSALAEHDEVHNVYETVGGGIRGTCTGLDIVIGSKRYLQDSMVYFDESTLPPNMPAYVAIDGLCVGGYQRQATLRKGVGNLVSTLRSDGYQASLLSGDGTQDSSLLQPLFSKSESTYSATPAVKVEFIERLHKSGESTLMIGDGLNDVSAMAVSDVSIAVTNSSSMLAPASDIVLPGNRVRSIHQLLTYSRKLKAIIWGLLWFTMAYNAVGISLALMGILTPVITAVMMPLSSLMVIGASVFGAKSLARRFECQ